MANFEAQVNGITDLAISGSSTDPGQTELTQFLIDGVLDVTNRCIAIKPQEREQFTRVSGEVTSNGSEKVDRADILHVVRESGTNNDWRSCRKITTAQQSRVADTESLHFASKFNPVYMVAEDGAISVFPAPGTTTDAFKVYYINNNPRGDDDNSVTYGTSGLAFFPKDKVYLVVIYAAIRSLQAAMSAFHGNTDISAAIILIKAAVDQAEVAANKFTSATESVFGDEDTFDTAASQLTRVKDALNNAEKIIDDGASSPTGNAAGDAATYLYTEEDTELVQGALGIAQSEIQRAQAHLAEWTSIGDMRVKEIQASLAESSGYAKEVQTRMANLQQEYTWYDGRLKDLRQEYEMAFQLMRPPQPQPQQGARV